jgi:hypothetical protein
MNLSVGNGQTRTVDTTLAGGTLYAPFIIADGNVESLLDNDLANDPAIYFAYLGSNSDKTNHIRVLGDNILGFEDLHNGGDFDYNDAIISVKFNPL